jgi:hypothetical protein
MTPAERELAQQRMIAAYFDRFVAEWLAAPLAETTTPSAGRPRDVWYRDLKWGTTERDLERMARRFHESEREAA